MAVAIADTGPNGERIHDDSFVFMFNAWERPVEFVLAGSTSCAEWPVAVNTRRQTTVVQPARFAWYVACIAQCTACIKVVTMAGSHHEDHTRHS